MNSYYHRQERRMRNCITAIVVIFVALTLGGLKGCVFGCGQGYSEGERTGVVTKMSNKGLVWKSWEGSMAMGMSAPQGEHNVMQPVQFDFSVVDPKIVETLRAAQKSGKPVTVVYDQWINTPIELSTDYVITEVR